MPQTANKGYEVQITGTNEDTWGIVLNDDVIAIIDANLGGIVTKTLGATQVDLDATESQQLICRLIGTLSANVLVTTLCVGMTVVENMTSGAFAVTFQLNGVGTPVTIPQGTRAVVITGPTLGARIAADNRAEFAAGTVMPFYQQTAPTGWTKQVVDTNIGVRITSGTDGGTIAGSANFTDIFTTRGITGTVGGTAISVAQMPVHGHSFRLSVNNDDDVDTSGGLAMSQGGETDFPPYTGTLTNTPGQQIGAGGGGQSHDHSLSINNLNMNLRYMNMIVCTKN